MGWNPVFDRYLKVKTRFKDKFRKRKSLWDYDHEKDTCLTYWLREIGDQNLSDIFETVAMNEHDGFLLLRYKQPYEIGSFAKDRGIEDLWNYENGFLKECRSLVIDTVNDDLALTPFPKFLNLNEMPETSEERVSELIRNADTVEFSDKLDGSMQSARWYRGSLLMSGSKALDPNKSFQLRDGMDFLKSHDGYLDMLSNNRAWTFVFEWISPNDAHVVRYSPDQTGLYLVGCRNSHTGDEIGYSEMIELGRSYGVPTTEVFDTSLGEVLGSLDSKTSDEAEGFVISIDGYRVKVKYDDYVSMHRILSEVSSPKVIIQNIADGRWDDFISKVPESHRDRVMSIADRVFDYQMDRSNRIHEYLDTVNEMGFSTMKDAMIWITDNVPRELQGMVRSLYHGNEVNVLKPGSGYVKWIDIDRFTPEK